MSEKIWISFSFPLFIYLFFRMVQADHMYNPRNAHANLFNRKFHPVIDLFDRWLARCQFLTTTRHDSSIDIQILQTLLDTRFSMSIKIIFDR